ncbi:tRNA (adenine(58)-N(1))-methyltransferase, mitochondrial [Microcaecilia unicolor]|uniref:tRNA (adenine(58)-N(1))-methyltransferase n=1 Tax=Microcaecilia unicolor TaxID=1415580 RepID=A0A6P7XFM2_9AMPH|nr:tRNA (adenine(58)-N(1))-methyltransferase, mitochondrial [Microcaecilia unicolor]
MIQICTGLRLPTLFGVPNPCMSIRLLGRKKRACLQLSHSLTVTSKVLVESAPSGPRDTGNDDKFGERFEADSSVDVREQTACYGSLSSRRKRVWERSLSPLERMSQLIPAEFISSEVTDLGLAYQEDSTKNIQKPVLAEGSEIGSRRLKEHLKTKNRTVSEDTPLAPYREANLPFKVGELYLAEFRRKYYLEFKKMSILTGKGKLNSKWGDVSHNTIIGKLPGQMFRTSLGYELLLRRPSLEEFVLMMKRGPVISFPKDMKAMLMMMDISPGNVVLEAGSGSGGMSLFLSRAVGCQGHVLSFEVRNDHHLIAKKNYERWRTAWKVTHEEEWPDNVNFINKDIVTAAEDTRSITFDAVTLDMLHPQVALPVVFPCLKQGGVCTVYLVNITQVVDLLEGIRSCQVSLFCENIIEVIHTDWLVLPSKQKDGSFSKRMAPPQSEEVYNQQQTIEHEQEDQTHLDKIKAFGSVPYVARPYSNQNGHTAFLVKLRKFKPANIHPEPEASDFSQGNDIA